MPQPPLEALRGSLPKAASRLPDGLPRRWRPGVFGYPAIEWSADGGLPASMPIRSAFHAVLDPADARCGVRCGQGQHHVVTPVRPEPGVTVKAARPRAGAAPIGRGPMRSTGRSTRRHASEPAHSTFGEVQHLAGRIPHHGAEAKDYILPAIFRWCCPQRFQAPIQLPPLAL